MHYFVKRLLTCALDRNNREREMASVALSSLYAVVVPPEQVQKGFFSLIDSIGEHRVLLSA
jgi:programmed cell death protein 4